MIVMKYRCPHCRRTVDVPEEHLGTTIHCPHPNCERPFKPEAPRVAPVGREESGKQVEKEIVHEVVRSSEPDADEQMITTVHPAMARNHPFWFVLLIAMLAGGIAVALGAWPALEGQVWMIAGWSIAGVALLAFFIWWVSTRFVALNITNERTQFREGLIARETSEVRHEDVRNLQVDQSISQRLLGVGTLAVSSAGQDDMEILIHGIPRPDKVAELIRSYQ